MNRIHTLIAKAVALATIASLSGFAAADSQNLSLTATVTAQCRFTSVATTMAFGNVDPSAAGPINGVLAIPVTYKCTKGVTPGTFSFGVGQNTSNRMKDTVSGDFIPYTLVLGAAVAGTGFGATENKTLPLTGSIAATDYQNVSAGSYSDSVVLTVSP
jgi:spore coat protein U-like protein